MEKEEAVRRMTELTKAYSNDPTSPFQVVLHVPANDELESRFFAQQCHRVMTASGQYAMTVVGFDGLELRAHFQDEKQRLLLQETVDLQKQAQETMEAIQGLINVRYEQVVARSVDLDRRLVRVLSAVGLADETAERFRDLQLGVEVSDVQGKMRQLLGVLKGNDPLGHSSCAVLDEKAVATITGMLEEEQQMIMWLDRQLHELRAAFEGLKARFLHAQPPRQK